MKLPAKNFLHQKNFREAAHSSQEAKKNILEVMTSFMKISIKGIFLSEIAAALLAFVMILPLAVFAAIFDVDIPTTGIFRLYGILVFIVFMTFQGFVLAKVAGPEKFPSSAICCAVINGILTFSNNGILWGVFSCVASVVLLYLGRMCAK